ncbi:hypothetical protein GIB67_022126 [Kingdonia uniflora]|uniref:Uncharacterized protein n=1 Tax=Kingdonia uniflora TaxID=39325 RepID=A0A7J7N8K1_9MAGN|nr:hypothetical protein GIB67_022126 [Kingdonia uniflora]
MPKEEETYFKHMSYTNKILKKSGETISQIRNFYVVHSLDSYKAQEETDPLGTMPKKESGSIKDSEQRSVTQGECSATSEDEDAGSEDEDLAEADEDDSDLDLAWKMLDVTREIVEKNLDSTMEKVDILPEEAIPYCQKAISVCKARIQRLMNEMKSSVGSASTTITSQNVDQSMDGNQADASEIETPTGLSRDLEKKLEDLQ